MAEANFINDGLIGRVALVTGGSRGIGRAICLALAAKGATVAVHYRAQAAAADEVVEQIHSMGGKAAAFQADMADFVAPKKLIEQVAQLGSVDILVNNAAEMTDSSVAEMSDEAWEQTMSVNLGSVFRCARAVIPAMKARGWDALSTFRPRLYIQGLLITLTTPRQNQACWG